MKKFILISAAIIIAFSCNKNDLEQIYTKQEADIDSYITRQYANDSIFRKGGSNRITVDSTDIKFIDTLGYADSLEFGDSLYFYFAGFVFTNQPSAIFATNNEFVAEEAKMDLADSAYSMMKILYTPDYFVEGLTNGLYNAKNGEHCLIIFSGKYGFQNKIVANIPKNSALAYEIWIMDIIKN